MTRSDILDKAKECITGRREQDYGSPEDNFKIIANLWAVYKGVQFLYSFSNSRRFLFQCCI